MTKINSIILHLQLLFLFWVDFSAIFKYYCCLKWNMLNTKNPVVQELIKLQWEIAKSEMSKELQEKEIGVGS